MNDATEDLIQERFNAVANRVDDADWGDVIARAATAEKWPLRSQSHRGTRLVWTAPRSVVITVAVIVLAATATAVGFGWPQTIIDFFSSPSAPESVKVSFGAQNVGAPIGMSPQAIPGEAREIMSATFDSTGIHPEKPTLHTLCVAPTEGGGFCYQWTEFSGSCAPVKDAPMSPEMRALEPLGITWLGNDYPLVLSGWVRFGETEVVEAAFGDGTSATIPVTWVSAPIDAGFLLYVVPKEHQTRSTGVTAVVARDDDGRVIGRQDLPLTDPLDQPAMLTLPDGTKTLVSQRADAANARKIISFQATDGSDVWLWVMPRRGGGVCFAFNQGGGCPPPDALASGPPLAAGLASAPRRVLFEGTAGPEIAVIQLRYENGTTESLVPVEGFVLHEITPAHYRPGTRLVAAIALDRTGREIVTQTFPARQSAIYPCDKPIDRGYGVKSCP